MFDAGNKKKVTAKKKICYKSQKQKIIKLKQKIPFQTSLATTFYSLYQTFLKSGKYEIFLGRIYLNWHNFLFLLELLSPAGF